MSILTMSGNGSRLAKGVPLVMGDNVEKADIEICKSPNGDGDWLLGKGASGMVRMTTHHTRSCWVLSTHTLPAWHHSCLLDVILACSNKKKHAVGLSHGTPFKNQLHASHLPIGKSNHQQVCMQA